MLEQMIRLTDVSKDNYYYEEAIKTLRTNLQFSGKNNKAILITSTVPGEGKSDISFHLAAELGKAGKKVLLIDADIRKSVYISQYQIEQQVYGLSQYLSGQVDKLEQFLCRTNYENLHMILAGPAAPNPSEMLGDATFGELIRATRKVYDYVLIDTPPINSVIDAAVVGQHCDGALLVVESGGVSYREVQKAKTQLEKSGCRVLGAVLNKMDVHSSRYYRSYYKSDKYYYGSSQQDQ